MHPDQPTNLNPDPSTAYVTNLEQLVSARTQQLRQSQEQLERSYDTTLEALGNALGLKSPETLQHSRRVTAFAIAIARAMNLPREQLQTLARSAFLHDIGKLAVDEAILRKPTPFAPDETCEIRHHCQYGLELVRSVPFLASCAEIVYTHHEHFDGSGYPRGLKSNAIPLGARIIAVANAFDAMTVDQPYRSARSFADARAEIERHAGRQFDPEVVQAFLTLPEHVWAELRTEAESSARQASEASVAPAIAESSEGSGAAADVPPEIQSLFGHPGEPVPAVNPADLKAVWAYSKQVQERHPNGLVATTANVYQRLCSPGADVRAVGYRCGVLNLLHRVLAARFEGGEPTDAVFKVAARVDLKFMGLGAVQQGPGLDVDRFFAEVRDEAQRAD